MKTNISRGLLLSALLLVALRAEAQTVPALINYQGQLTDAGGAPLATTDYMLTFTIHDAATGGSQVWGPQVFDGVGGQGHGPKIPVVQGFFNVMLGPVDTGGVSIKDAFNAINRFVEIKVGNNNAITPRQQVLSAPFAIKAESAEKLTVPGGSATAVSVAGNGNVGVGTINPAQAKLVVRNSDSSTAITEQTPGTIAIINPDLTAGNYSLVTFNDGQALTATAALGTWNIVHSSGSPTTVGDLAFFTKPYGTSTLSERMRVTSSGNLGIGITSPQTKLDVAGTVKATTFQGSGSELSGIGTGAIVDGSITSAKLADGAVTSAKLLDGAVTPVKLLPRLPSTNAPLGGIAISQSSQMWNTNVVGSLVWVSPLRVSLATSGRPVFVTLIPCEYNGSPEDASLVGVWTGSSSIRPVGNFALLRNGTVVRINRVDRTQGVIGDWLVPGSSVSFIDFPPAVSSVSYSLYAELRSGGTIYVYKCRLAAFEL